MKQLKDLYKNAEGRVAPPLILWFLGVPGSVCLLLWVFFWRGK